MKTPIRCFEGQAKPHEPFWQVRNATETGGDPEMEFYGYISEYSWFEDDVTPQMFKDDLYNLGGGGPITIRLNSGGGDVIAASVIRTIISDYPGAVTVRIDGLAASAAVIVALAGKTVRIMDTAYMMIHDPAIVVMMAALDIDTLKQLYDALQSVKTGIVDVYKAKTGISTERLIRMMAAETWMSASEAVNYGFADEVITGGQAAANRLTNAAFINALQNYVNVPTALAELARDGKDPQPVTNPAVERLRAEIQLCKGA